MGELAKGGLLNTDCLTVTGKTVAENLAERNAHILDTDVIRTWTTLHQGRRHSILRGNIAPEGAVVKKSAVAEEMLCRDVRARVFEGEADA